jgi:hypothetical protein
MRSSPPTLGPRDGLPSARGGASSAMRLNFSLAAPDAAARGLQILGELLGAPDPCKVDA